MNIEKNVQVDIFNKSAILDNSNFNLNIINNTNNITQSTTNNNNLFNSEKKSN